MPKSWIPLLVGLVNLLRANPGDLIEQYRAYKFQRTENEAMVARRTAELSESQEASQKGARLQRNFHLETRPGAPLQLLFLGVLQTEAPNRPPGGGGSKPEMGVYI